MHARLLFLLATWLVCTVGPAARMAAAEARPDNARPPASERELREWLTNMVAYHRFTVDEVRAATGLASEEITAALKRFQITPGVVPPREAGDAAGRAALSRRPASADRLFGRGHPPAARNEG